MHSYYNAVKEIKRINVSIIGALIFFLILKYFKVQDI